MNLNAIICTWNEEDIIYATVRHALAQGCDQVYILDNESSDRTVQQAVRAGGVYLAKFKTDVFDEAQKTVYINKCVEQANRSLEGDRNWWLYIDADEFPDFGNGRTIRQNLAELPPDVRAAGSLQWLHLPTHEPYYLPGWHPADFMPLAERIGEGIFKFNLLRHDREQPPIYAMSGAHVYNANGGAMREAEIRCQLHHFNYRRPERGRKRLEELVLPDRYGKRRVDWLDRLARQNGEERHFYHDRLAGLEKVYRENRLANLKKWASGYDFRKLIRWYRPEEIRLPEDLRPYDRLVWQGTYAFLRGERALAAEAFRAAAASAAELAAEGPQRLREEGLALLGLARSLRSADPEGAELRQVLGALKVFPLDEVRRAAGEFF